MNAYSLRVFRSTMVNTQPVPLRPDPTVSTSKWPNSLRLSMLAGRVWTDFPAVYFFAFPSLTSVSVLYGSAYTGKSALAVHLAACLASGTAFFGRATEALPVFYLALENIQDVQAHVLAIQMERGTGWTWPRPLALSGREADLGNETDMKALAADIRRMTGGAPAALLVDALLDGIDGRDITSNADMAAVMKNAHALVAAILGPLGFIHHANRTMERSVLGASVILTRADVHIRVDEARGGANWKADKVKGAKRIEEQGFSFKEVSLGLNSAGQSVSSCVIVEADGALEPLPSPFATAKRRPSASGARQKKTASEGATHLKDGAPAPAKRPAGHATKPGGGWASLRTARR